MKTLLTNTDNSTEVALIVYQEKYREQTALLAKQLSVALLEEAKNGEISYVTEDITDVKSDLKLSEEEIRERMSGNICRCGAYNNIVQAFKEVHSGHDEMPTWEFATREQMDKAKNA